MKLFEQVYCVIKTSAYQHYQYGKCLNYTALPEKQRIRIEQNHSQQQNFIKQLKETITTLGLDVQFIQDNELLSIQPTAKDLVLSCGGDGTFLSCAQHYGKSVLLGLNPNFQQDRSAGSYGALTLINQHNLQQCLKQLKHQDYHIQLWPRLSARVSNRLIGRYAVNEIYIGPADAFSTCSLSLDYNKKQETFKCSGFIACTQLGSQAWYASAGGQSFENKNNFAFLVLMPNRQKPYQFTTGVLEAGQELVLSCNRQNQILCLDSKKNIIPLALGDKIHLFLAVENAAKVLYFNSKIDK